MKRWGFFRWFHFRAVLAILKRGFRECGNGFGGCDIFDGFGVFRGFGGFSRFSGFGGFDGFDGFIF